MAGFASWSRFQIEPQSADLSRETRTRGVARPGAQRKFTTGGKRDRERTRRVRDCDRSALESIERCGGCERTQRRQARSRSRRDSESGQTIGVPGRGVETPSQAGVRPAFRDGRTHHANRFAKPVAGRRCGGQARTDQNRLCETGLEGGVWEFRFVLRAGFCSGSDENGVRRIGETLRGTAVSGPATNSGL